MMINIGTDDVAKDRAYRYKMPPLKSKIEGRGNGIKTVILNIKEVSDCFKMDPRYTTKFFGVELGAQSKYDPKRDNGVGVVNGSFQTKELQMHLKTFVHEIVLCPNQQCRYPETTIVKCDKKREQLQVDCAACGFTGPLPTEHRIVQYFIKHPPATCGKKSGKKKKLTAKERRAAKMKQAKLEAKAAVEGPAKKKKKKSGERKPRKEDVWYCDISPAKLKAREDQEREDQERAQKQAELAKKRGVIKEKDFAKDAPSLILKDFLLSEPTEDDIVGEIERLELARSLALEQKFKALFEAIFDMNDPSSIRVAYEKYAGLLRRFTGSADNGKIFIGVFEDVMCRPGLRNYMIPRSAIYFKSLYDLGVVGEDALMEWYETPAEEALMASKADAEEIKEAAGPLMAWFKKHREGEAAG